MSSVLPTGVLASIAIEITTITETGVDEITVSLSLVSFTSFCMVSTILVLEAVCSGS